MDAQVETHIAVLIALAVLLWPAAFYLWLRWWAEKHFGPFDGDVARSALHDRRSELKQARRSLSRLIRRKTGALNQ